MVVDELATGVLAAPKIWNAITGENSSSVTCTHCCAWSTLRFSIHTVAMSDVGAAVEDVDLRWRMFLRHFDIEHTSGSSANSRLDSRAGAWPTAGSGSAWPRSPSCTRPVGSPTVYATSGRKALHQTTYILRSRRGFRKTYAKAG